jgi:hypothetical protein
MATASPRSGECRKVCASRGSPARTEPSWQVHHIVPVSEGGTISLDDMTLGGLLHHRQLK